MKKTIFVFGLLFVMLFSLTATVLAAPTNGQKISVVQITGTTLKDSLGNVIPVSCVRDGLTYPYTGTNSLTPGELVAQRRDYGQYMGTTLIIDGTTTLKGWSFNNLDRMFQYDTETRALIGSMMVIRYKAIWEFQPQIGLDEYGGFEGNINMVITDYNPPTYQVRFACLLHGFGAFEGQTLQFTYNGPSGQPWEGYLLKP